MKIGIISETVKNVLGLSDVLDSNIYLGKTNIQHMCTSHPDAYLKYKDELENILKYPDYVGLNPKDNSIEYVKNFLINSEYVKVAVRVSTAGKYYARSIYVLNKVLQIINYVLIIYWVRYYKACID